LSAPFFPVEIFPQAIQYISYIMPFTDVFNASRMFATTGVIETGIIIKGFIVTACYFIISWPVYYAAFRRAKKTGLLAKMT